MKTLRVPTTDVLSTKVKSILLVWAASSVLVLPTMYLGLRILAMANSHVTYVLYFLPFLSLALIALYSEYYSHIVKWTYGLLNKQAFQGFFFYTLLVELFLYKRKLTYYFVGLVFFGSLYVVYIYYLHESIQYMSILLPIVSMWVKFRFFFLSPDDFGSESKATWDGVLQVLGERINRKMAPADTVQMGLTAGLIMPFSNKLSPEKGRTQFPFLVQRRSVVLESEALAAAAKVLRTAAQDVPNPLVTAVIVGSAVSFVGIGLIGEHTKSVDLARKAEQEDRKVALEERIHASNLKLENEKLKLEQERFSFEKQKYWHQHKAETEQLAARDNQLDLNVSDTDLVIPETATSMFGKHRSLSQQVVDTLIQSKKMSDLPDSE